MSSLNSFMAGACSMASTVAALFFFRFWRASHDRLFLYFALAFLGMTINWVGVAVFAPAEETRHWLYVFRLIAFLLIVVAIVDKNRSSTGGS